MIMENIIEMYFRGDQFDFYRNERIREAILAVRIILEKQEKVAAYLAFGQSLTMLNDRK